jgi:REP element-mobilizing transposase RayT
MAPYPLVQLRAKGPIYRRYAMPQSHSLVIVHITFSTKDRVPNLGPSVRPDLHAYLSTVARNAGCGCYRVGGVADHVHLAIRLARTLTIAGLIEEVKSSSSKWLKSHSTPYLVNSARYSS